MAPTFCGIDLRLDLPSCEEAGWAPQPEEPVIPLVRRRAPPRVRTKLGTCGPAPATVPVDDPIEPSGWQSD